jgi:hypothetical protein
MKTDFRTWDRRVLEQFAQECSDENKTLRELMKALHESWKKEVALNASLKDQQSGNA